MRVLFLVRKNLLESKAGDTIQVLKTREYLQRMGVKVELSTSPIVDMRSYDVVHLFNSNYPGELFHCFCLSKEQGKPTALSTIYWDMKDYIRQDKETTTTLDWWNSVNLCKKEIFRQVDILLPNSEGEYRRLAQDLSINNRYHVVPNGADRLFLEVEGRSRDFINKYGVKDFVLCVGRIAYRKNQLTLIRALNSSDIPVVLIGCRDNRPYFNTCKKEAGDNFIFIDEMPHESLPDAYAAARVHVLPSWFETPGLANLEAALSGCHVVTTPFGTTREYFGNLATYCDPGDVLHVRESVFSSFERPRDKELQEYVKERFTWEKAAAETLKAYQRILYQR